MTRELIKRAPHAKNTHTDHELDKLIREVHSDHHDPNVLLLLAVDDEDREAKANGFPAVFLGGRQKALDHYAPQSGEFQAFLQEKQKGNASLLSFYTGNPDESVRSKLYADAKAQWKSAGDLIRGEVTHILKKTPGSYLGGAKEPGEADCEFCARVEGVGSDGDGERAEKGEERRM